jgi:hypothetical protein
LPDVPAVTNSIDIFTSSATVEWGTPRSVIDGIRAIGYDLTLDVCATPGREICRAYYGPPLEEIGRYKVTKGPERGTWKVDSDFKTRALRHAIEVNTPLALDALAQNWTAALAQLGGCAWMNPPFGSAIKAFITKAWEEAQRGACVVSIIPSRTGTRWWHKYIEPVRLGAFPGVFDFWKGRMSFVNTDGKTTTPAPFDMAVVIWDGRKLLK